MTGARTPAVSSGTSVNGATVKGATVNGATFSATVAGAAGAKFGPVDQIPVGEGRAFAVDGQQVAVFRLRSGRLYAVGGGLSAPGGPIADGQIDGRVVMCPLHQNTFELATGLSTGGLDPLGTWPVEVDRDGDLVIHPRTG